MGLDTSHDAFHGAYSAFNRLRQAVCWAAGGSFPYHDRGDPRTVARLAELGLRPPTVGHFGRVWDDAAPRPPEGEADQGRWYVPDAVTREAYPGLYLFLSHEDCEGSLTPAECLLVAADLEPLVPLVDSFAPAGGHIEHQGGFAAVLRKFTDGCRRAAAANEPLEFH